MPTGGVAIPTPSVPGSWLMAQYFATGDPGWIVPIQSLERGPSSFNLQAFKRFGVGYPDQELVSAIVGDVWTPRIARGMRMAERFCSRQRMDLA